MFWPASSGLCPPGLATGAPIGIRHAASGIWLWPKAGAKLAAKSAAYEINRFSCTCGSLQEGSKLIIHGAAKEAESGPGLSRELARRGYTRMTNQLRAMLRTSSKLVQKQPLM